MKMGLCARATAGAVAAFALCGVSAPAWADSYVGARPPTVPGHVVPFQGPNGAEVLGIQFTRSPSGAPQELPFSGADVVELTTVALGSIAAGVLMSRAHRQPKAG
jgi:hypothetical protein